MDELPFNLPPVKLVVRAIIDDMIARQEEQQSIAKHLRCKIDDVAQQRRIPWARVQDFCDEVTGTFGTPLTKLTTSQLRLVLKQVKERR